MIEWVINTYSDSDLIKFFFWGPVLFNAIVYPVHIWVRVQKDRAAVAKWEEDFALAEKENKSNYRPKLFDETFVSIGSIFKYFFLTVVPVLNALATIFHAGPIAFEYLANRFAWLFKCKLVRK